MKLTKTCSCQTGTLTNHYYTYVPAKVKITVNSNLELQSQEKPVFEIFDKLIYRCEWCGKVAKKITNGSNIGENQ